MKSCMVVVDLDLGSGWLLQDRHSVVPLLLLPCILDVALHSSFCCNSWISYLSLQSRSSIYVVFPPFYAQAQLVDAHHLISCIRVPAHRDSMLKCPEKAMSIHQMNTLCYTAPRLTFSGTTAACTFSLLVLSCSNFSSWFLSSLCHVDWLGIDAVLVVPVSTVNNGRMTNLAFQTSYFGT